MAGRKRDKRALPEGGTVADPWKGVKVRARVYPAPRMPGWLIAARASGWPERRKLVEALRRDMGAEQVVLFGRAER